MGCRMIDEFFARQLPTMKHCKDFRETMEVIAKMAFRMFLGFYADVSNWDNSGLSCSLILKENPMADFVVLPSKLSNKLWYTNILCGIIRGALEMINVKVKAYFIKDILRGDLETEIRVELIEIVKDGGNKEEAD